jgi:hypothetical protein
VQSSAQPTGKPEREILESWNSGEVLEKHRKECPGWNEYREILFLCKQQA